MFKRIICLFVAVILMGGLLTPEDVAAKSKEKIYKVAEIKSDDYGCRTIQKAGKTDCAFYRWDTWESIPGTGDTKFRLYTYFRNGEKIKRKKTIVGKNVKGEQQKAIRKIQTFFIGDGCMDTKGKYLYLPSSDFGNKISLYKFSLTKDKVKKIDLSKHKYIKNLTKSSRSPNDVKCYPIASDKIGLRVDRRTKKYGDIVGYRTFVLNTKTNKLTKRCDCDFRVEGMNENYVYGFEMSDEGRLCYRRQKKGAKVIRVSVDNPQVEIDTNVQSYDPQVEAYDPTVREHCTRVAGRGNKLYYVTLKGLFCFNMKTKKSHCILRTDKSKYMKNYIPEFVHAITVNEKGYIYLLCAQGWKSGFKVIRVRAK